MASKAKSAKKGLVSTVKFAAMVKGLTGQGVPYYEAVSTVSEGLRQANGLPVKKQEVSAVLEPVNEAEAVETE